MLSNYLVIDTNVLISALLFPHSKPSSAIAKAFSEYIVCVSTETLNEFLEVSQRPKFRKYINSQDLEIFTSYFIDGTKLIEITEKVTDCSDPKDNKFLEVALSAKAKYLVTGDKRDLLSMNPYKKVEIISVSDFLALPSF